MTTGRTINKYARVYVDGYDLSGHTRSIGPLSCTFAEGADDPLTASVIGTWLGQATISPGTLNAMFDNTASSGIHALHSTAGINRNVLVAQGIQAVPAQGDPVFCGQFMQDDYMTGPGETPSTVTIKFSPSSGTGSALNYSIPFGVLLRADTATTTDNAAAGVDGGGETLYGGYMMYQILASTGSDADITAAIKVQDSTSSGGAYSDLLTSGTIHCHAGTSGVVALAKTAHVQEFTRWQVGWGSATSLTFILGFVRNFTP
jgi:hypothetical protein